MQTRLNICFKFLNKLEDALNVIREKTIPGTYYTDLTRKYINIVCESKSDEQNENSTHSINTDIFSKRSFSKRFDNWMDLEPSALVQPR